MKKLTSEWIEKAEEDFFAASHLAGAGRLTPYNVICFLCQQAVEKWLKARLSDAPKNGDADRWASVEGLEQGAVGPLV